MARLEDAASRTEVTPSEASEAGPQAVAGGAPVAAERGDAAGRRKRPRNRRRNRRSRDGSDDAVHAEAAPAGHGGQTPVTVVLQPTEVSDIFSDVLSGAYDSEDPARDGAGAAPAGGTARAGGEAPQAVVPSGPAEGGDAPAVVAAQADESDTATVSAETAAPAEPTEAGAVPPQRRVLGAEPEAPKLQKVLAQSGVGSRRDLEQMIAEGRIAVNGQPAHVGQRVKAGDRITLDGKPVRVRITPPPPRVLAYHKPAGEVVTHDDPQARPTVFRRLPRLPHGKWQSVGRLDINTEGLLLFTNSGDLANRLMHPRFGVEREYAVRVLGELAEDERARLLEGVEIDGQPCAFRSITDGGGEGANRWYRVVITEGRNREVRRLFEAVGKAVSRLIRIRYGSVVLPRGLRRGVWVDLGPDDVRALREATGMPQPAAKGGRDAAGDDRRAGRRGRRGRKGRRAEAGLEGLPASAGRAADMDGDEDQDFSGPIPNPLQQTYDKRAIQQARRTQRSFSEDGPIPNPLQQTYDKRAVEAERRPRREFSEDGPIPNPLQQTYDKRFAQATKAPGKPGPAAARRKGGGNRQKPGPGGQPDPMRTAVGYIGGDAFLDKLRAGGGRGGGRGGRRKGR